VQAAASVATERGARPVRSQGFWARSWRRFARNRGALLALGLLLVLHAAVSIGPVLITTSPNAVNLMARFAPPDHGHPLGTDEMGRDLLARLLHGGRLSLGIGLSAMIGAILIGTIFGSVSGFLGGAVDAVIMRVTDAMLSFPLFFFLLTVLALIGSTISNVVIVIAATSWMGVARIVRSEVLRMREFQFVEAARAVGNKRWRILFFHILPHTLPLVIVAATLGVANAILTESGLSYLGLGVKPPDPSWGNMLSSARSYTWNAPHLVLYPGFCIFVTVLLFNSMGDGLRDALDPTSTE
jgi:peptide/nickel transport system permease protein